jgi:hypothetical protein
MAQSTNLIPSLKLGDNTELKVWGWTHGSYVEDREPHETDLSMLVIRQKLTVGNRWELFLDTDLAKIESGGSWLRQANISYYLNPDEGADDTESWKLTLGRIFISAGNTTPAPFMVETVSYPESDHFTAYAWGLQLSGKWGNGWSISGDVTTASWARFDAKECWDLDHLEASARLEKASDTWSLAGTAQISQDFWRAGIDGSLRPNGHLSLRGALYYERKNDYTASDHFGGYLFVGYRATKWLELHGMLDHSQALPKEWVEVNSGVSEAGEFFYEELEMRSSDATRTTLTIGPRFFIGENTTVTIDCTIPVDGQTPGAKPTIGARVQFRF